MVSEKKVFNVFYCSTLKVYGNSFLHYKSMETLYPGGGATLGPRGLISRIYVVDH